MRKLILISISLLIAGGVLAKDACEDESFKNKYQSYCAKKGYETISVLCEGSLKNKPRYKEYCKKICDGSIKPSKKNKPMYEQFCKKKLNSKKSKKSKKSDSKNTLVCPKPFFKESLIAMAYDEKKEIFGEALRRTRNDSVYRGELRAINNRSIPAVRQQRCPGRNGACWRLGSPPRGPPLASQGGPLCLQGPASRRQCPRRLGCTRCSLV